jgi:lambda repressor-like predicted transcriptional regulator
MHPEEIKAALRIKGFTQAILADELEVAASSVSQAITGHIRSERIQKRISEIIGKPVKTIWPDQVRLRRTKIEIEAQRSRRSAA